MRPYFKNKTRLYLVLSVMILQQCCCCILPVGWQMQKENPAVQQILRNIESKFAPLASAAGWLDAR